jgi:hypothetical protein
MTGVVAGGVVAHHDALVVLGADREAGRRNCSWVGRGLVGDRVLIVLGCETKTGPFFCAYDDEAGTGTPDRRIRPVRLPRA